MRPDHTRGCAPRSQTSHAPSRRNTAAHTKLAGKTAASAVLAVIFGALMSAAPAAASGTVSISPSSQSQNMERSEYAVGRKIYRQKLACKTCEYAGGLKKGETASMAYQRVQANEFGLTAAETRALSVYLKKRFKLG